MSLKTAVRGRAFERPEISPTTWGILLALGAAVISGFSIWVNSYAVKEVRDPTVFAGAKNALVGIAFLALLAAAPRRKASAARWGRRSVAALVGLGVIGGSVPFVLFFEGLASAGPGNGAFIQKTLFLWVALLAVPLLGERLSPWHVFALAMLALAQWLIGHPAGFEFGRPEAMILAATLLWACEVMVARWLLPELGALVGATARMGIGGLALVGYVAVTGKLDVLTGLSSGQWLWVIVTAATLFFYVGAWYGALRLAPATVVTSILTLGAPITALLSTQFSGRPAPTGEQIAGYVLVAAAGAILTAMTFKRARASAWSEARA
jgi:drug/metabolite transporter (DMT)-like permease